MVSCGEVVVFRGEEAHTGTMSETSGEDLLGGRSGSTSPAAPPGRRGPSPIRVVIVDDHALVREGTHQLLERSEDLEVVGEAGSGEDAVGVLEQLRPDVAIVDVNLPGMSGLELARTVVASLPEVRILVVSAYDDYAYVTEALEIGVGGYLLKHASSQELIDAVRAVADGVFVLDRSISARLARRWRSDSPTAGGLTRQETDVLSLLARGGSDEQIASELGVGLRSVEGQVSSILGKLGVTSRTGAVAYALGHHLVDSEDHGHPDPPD
jgi:DNA-binding NarL/FixJ family response regulator